MIYLDKLYPILILKGEIMTEQKIASSTGSAPSGNRKGLAIAGLILGIISLCSALVPYCAGLFGVIGIILSVLGLKSSKGLAIAGLIISILGLLLGIGVFIAGKAVLSGDIYNTIMNQIQSSINSTGY